MSFKEMYITLSVGSESQRFLWNSAQVIERCADVFPSYFIKNDGCDKGEGFLSFAATWMELEDIRLSEISQAQEDKHGMWHLHAEM
jgi:hypothetical protein